MTDDPRFTLPLYSVSEAAEYLGVPSQTFSRWARGYTQPRPSGRPTVSAPVVTSVGQRRQGAVIPFVGLAEGLVLAAFRRTGVPLQRIRPALDRLQREMGVEHALASKRLATDGVEILYDYGGPDVEGLIVVRSGQRVFRDLVAQYLRRIDYDTSGLARRITLPAYTVADVVADPAVNFGQPYFRHGGVRVEDVIDRWLAGESIDDLAADYGVPRQEIEDAARVSKQRPAA